MRDAVPGAMDWRRLAPVAALLLFGVCANGPPPDGTEGTVAGGAGRFTSVSCGTRYFHEENVVHAGARNGARTGWSQSVDLSRYQEAVIGAEDEQTGEPLEFDPEREVGWLIAMRAGYHGEHVGGEFGPAMLSWDGDDSGSLPLPTGNFWVGDRQIYGWVSLLDGAFSHANPEISLGLGSQLANGGYMRAGYGLGGPMLDVSAPIDDGFRVGGEVCLQSSDDWRVLARLTFFAPRPRAPRPPPPPTPEYRDVPTPEPEATPEATPAMVVDTAIAPATAGTAGP